MRKDRLLTLLGALAFAAIVFVLLARAQPVKVIDSHFERHGDAVLVSGDLRNTGAAAATMDLEIHYYDRAGRPLAVCMVEGTQLNSTLVAEGWARADRGQPDLLRIEAQARAERRGLWGGLSGQTW